MNDLVPKILREELGSYLCVPQPGGCVVFYPLGYAPFEPYPNTCGAIDAYYFASNAAYHRMRRLVARLGAAGVAASCRVALDYKRTLAEAGLMNTAVNTLCWTEASGTRFVLGATFVSVDLPPTPAKRTASCLHCGRCVAACPTGAISENGFERSRCLRQCMEERRLEDDDISELLGTSLLGCDVCQRVCPLNAGVRPVPVPENIRSATELGGLLFALCEKRTEGLAALIGTNYARSGKLLALTVNAMGNSGHAEYLTALRELPQEAGMLGTVKRRAIAKLEGTHAKTI